MEFAGVAMRDQDVQFGITPAQAREANATQRPRLLETLRDLPAQAWIHPTRCAGWSVQDVVRHLAQMNGVFLDALAAAEAGERFDAFRTFDPKRTPDEWVREMREVSAAQTFADFEASTVAILAACAGLDEAGTTLVATPAGRQPWPRGILHALFDSSVHERDVLAAVGTAAEPGPDLATIAAYQVLLAARVACLVGASFDAVLHLSGGPELSLSVAGPVVSVLMDATSADDGLVGTGEAVAVLDAMAGRGRLDEALDAPPQLHAALSGLSTLL
jgi:uncharacterized protein (TIGR03083 family)